eukprot:scaffold264745_cov36-Prasinocladus_malaysianus.AAC.3
MVKAHYQCFALENLEGNEARQSETGGGKHRLTHKSDKLLRAKFLLHECVHHCFHTTMADKGPGGERRRLAVTGGGRTCMQATQTWISRLAAS